MIFYILYFSANAICMAKPVDIITSNVYVHPKPSIFYFSVSYSCKNDDSSELATLQSSFSFQKTLT